MQFLASSLTHVWSIAAPSHYRQGSTFQTILVTKKHPRQRQAGSRRNFLGLHSPTSNSSCRESFKEDGSWIRRSLPPHPSRFSSWVLVSSLTNINSHVLTQVPHDISFVVTAPGDGSTSVTLQAHRSNLQILLSNISEWLFYKRKPNEPLFWYLIFHFKAFLGRD